MIRKTLKEKQELKLAKKNYKLSKTTNGHEEGRQEMAMAIFEGIKHAEKNWGGLKVETL